MVYIYYIIYNIYVTYIWVSRFVICTFTLKEKSVSFKKNETIHHISLY